MTVQTQRERIAAISATITGVDTGFARKPRAINTADMPACVVFVGPDVKTRQAIEILHHRREYLLILFVGALAQGNEGEIEERCDPFFERFEQAFQTRPGLWLADNTDALAGVQDAYLTTDAGITELNFNDASYLGINFTLVVEYLTTYQDDVGA